MLNMGSQSKSEDLEFTIQIQSCQTTDNPQTLTILFIPDKPPIRQEKSSYFAMLRPLKVDFPGFSSPYSLYIRAFSYSVTQPIIFYNILPNPYRWFEVLGYFSKRF